MEPKYQIGQIVHTLNNTTFQIETIQITRDAIYYTAKGHPLWSEDKISFNKPVSKLELNIGDEYWYISDSRGLVNIKWESSPADKFRSEIGNIFKTSAEAEAAIERMKVRQIMRNAGGTDKINCSPGWLAFLYDTEEDDVYVGRPEEYEYPIGGIYFHSFREAEIALNNIGEDRLIETFVGELDD